MGVEFKGWPKISRLANEKMTITEKIDGTNACIAFLPNPEAPFGYEVGIQSRNKLITPEADNAGFARWCWGWMDELYADLGFGYHFGEYWGSGIQRGYGLEKGEKRFSLFNAPRWSQAFEEGHTFRTPCLGIVPILYSGPFDGTAARSVCDHLYQDGSHAAPGYALPEGVVIYLHESRVSWKVTDTEPGNKHKG